VDRMVASIREFGFKIPVLVRRDAEVVDGHLDLPPNLRQLVKAQIPLNGELSHGIVAKAVHQGV